jgi:hypothetical protein
MPDLLAHVQRRFHRRETQALPPTCHRSLQGARLYRACGARTTWSGYLVQSRARKAGIPGSAEQWWQSGTTNEDVPAVTTRQTATRSGTALTSEQSHHTPDVTGSQHHIENVRSRSPGRVASA